MKRIKLFAVVATCLCMVGIGIPTCAQTVSYNITVQKGGNSPDPISKRATKADKEQRFYAIATGCLSGSGVVRAYSQQLNGEVRSNSLVISNYNIGIRQSATYTSNAPAGVYYYMQTFWDSGETNTINLVGRYTP